MIEWVPALIWIAEPFELEGVLTEGNRILLLAIIPQSFPPRQRRLAFD